MTRAEILDCLTDRPCDVCKFHESGRCERWDCVFEEEPDDCEDAISRQAAIDVVHEYFEKYLNLNDDICLDGIRSLPSVTPEQKMGHWINYQKNIWIYAQCSECGTVQDTKTNYCPNCGAKMVEPQESEDNE